MSDNDWTRHANVMPLPHLRNTSDWYAIDFRELATVPSEAVSRQARIAAEILAYCNVLRVPAAWLVYASGSQGAVTRRVSNTNIDIIEYPLQLDQPPGALLAR